MGDDAFSFVESIMNGDRTADKEESGTTTPQQHKNAPQRQTGKVLDEADTGRAVDIATATMQDNYKRAAEVYTKYQANIRAASNLRSELLLGAKAGRPLHWIHDRRFQRIRREHGRKYPGRVRRRTHKTCQNLTFFLVT